MKLISLLFCLSAYRPIGHFPLRALHTTRITQTRTRADIIKEIEILENECSKRIDDLCSQYTFDLHTKSPAMVTNIFVWNGQSITSSYNAKIKTLKNELEHLDANCD